MAYTVLARRYRSQSFEDVIGQEAIASTLKNAINTNRVAHAYLLSGTRGVGKTTMARVLAKSLNCLESDNPTINPCCKCSSCIAVNTGDDIDVVEIDGASNNGVDNIRELRQNAIYRPARARYKIYIIDEVHMLSTGAFNALLKILEEPPEHVKFIFATTEPNKVLATIQSRCQRFDFVNISAKDISIQLKKVLELEKIKYDDDLVLLLSRLANGSMRDSLSLLDQLISAGVEPLTVAVAQQFLGIADRDKVMELIGYVAQSQSGELLIAVDQLLNSGQGAVQLVDSLIEIMRDLMVIKASGNKTGLVILTDAERKAMVELCDGFDLPAIIYNITALEKLRYTVRTADNPRAILEATLLRFALSEQFIGTQQLIAAMAKGNIASDASVKKNLTNSASPSRAVSSPSVSNVTNTPSAAVATAQVAQVAKVVSGDVNFDTISQSWNGISTAVAGQLGSSGRVFSKSVPIAFDRGVLTLEFPAEVKSAVDIFSMPSKQKVLTSAISGAVGCNVTLKFTVAQGGPVAKPKGARISNDDKDKVLENEGVKAVLDGLGAVVTGIELG